MERKQSSKSHTARTMSSVHQVHSSGPASTGNTIATEEHNSFTTSTAAPLSEELSQGLRDSSPTVSQFSTSSNEQPQDFRGRPCFDICHKSFSSSGLSHRNRNIDLRGFLHLLFLIVIAQNARMVIENFMKYGKNGTSVNQSS